MIVDGLGFFNNRSSPNRCFWVKIELKFLMQFYLLRNRSFFFFFFYILVGGFVEVVRTYLSNTSD